MEAWAPEEIKALRLRLGWSAADFSRHFGCLADLILDWEKGAQAPSAQDVLQLHRLKFHVQSYSAQVRRDSTADRVIQERRLAQVWQADRMRDLN